MDKAVFKKGTPARKASPEGAAGRGARDQRQKGGGQPASPKEQKQKRNERGKTRKGLGRHTGREKRPLLALQVRRRGRRARTEGARDITRGESGLERQT